MKVSVLDVVSRLLLGLTLLLCRRHNVSKCNHIIGVGVDSNAANKVMEFIRENFVNGDTSSMEIGESGIRLLNAVEFRCVNSLQKMLLIFYYSVIDNRASSLKSATLILLMDQKHPNKDSFSISIYLPVILPVLFSVSAAPGLQAQRFVCTWNNMKRTLRNMARRLRWHYGG